MAKKKLSHEQRDALRAEMAKALKDGMKTADIVRTFSEKYGLVGMTVRYYLAGVEGGKKPGKPGRPKGFKSSGRPKGSKNKPRKAAGPKRKPGRPKGSTNGATPGFVSSAETLASAAIQRAKQAKRLIPKWRALLAREKDLLLQNSRISRLLKSISAKAKALGSKVKTLVGT
jgi:hypothetical protein